MKILVFIVFFLLMGGFYIISEKSIPLNNENNVREFFELYGEWFSTILGNTENISGNAVDSGAVVPL